MTPEQVSNALARFCAAWPWMDAGEATATVWSQALEHVDGTHSVEAANKLIANEDRPPSAAKFADLCRTLSRNNAGQLGPGPEPVSDRAEAARRIRAIRIGMAEAAKEVPAHRNHDTFGGAHCPACSTRGEREHVGTLVAAAIRSELEAES